MQPEAVVAAFFEVNVRSPKEGGVPMAVPVRVRRMRHVMRRCRRVVARRAHDQQTGRGHTIQGSPDVTTPRSFEATVATPAQRPL